MFCLFSSSSWLLDFYCRLLFSLCLLLLGLLLRWGVSEYELYLGIVAL